MYFSKSSLVAILAVLVPMCHGHIGGSQHLLQDISPQVYCGRNLARVLAILCYDEIPTEKKSEARAMYNSILTPYYKNQESQADWPWVPPHDARSMGLSRGNRFIVSELLSYC